MRLTMPHRPLCLLIALSGTPFLQALPVAHANGSALQSSTMSADDSVNKDPNGVAVKGYDVVSYFQDKSATKGNPAFSGTYKGATYYFASAEHRDTFMQNPEAYLPQYGGYCAFGTSKGHKADIDPESWTIIDNKLYLNSSKDAQKLFDKNPHKSIKTANANWQHLK